MKKKVFLFFLYMLLFAVTISAADLVEGDYTYTVADGEVTILAYTGTDTEVTVPATIDGLPVTAIGGKAFYKSAVVKVVLPDSVTSIGENAFGECSMLTEVELPDVLESMGEKVFYGCTALSKVTMPASMPYIPARTFYGCAVLDSGSLWMPADVTYIGEEAFLGCAAITSMHIRDCTSLVGDRAFADCDALFLVDVDAKDLTFGAYVFAGSPKVRLLCLRGSDAAAYAEASGLDYVYITCSEHTAGEAVVTPPTADADGVRILYCVDCCLELSREVLPATDFRYEIDDGEATIIEYLGRDAEVAVPAVLGGCPVTAIAAEAFIANTKLQRLTVPSGVRSIGESAFEGCSGLYFVDLPETLLSIGDDAFADAFASTFCTIDLPESITTMGDGVFANCSRLEAIDLPDSLRELGVDTFFGCNALNRVILPEGLTEIPAGTFYSSRMSLDMLYIPKSIKTIGKNAFWQGDLLGVSLCAVGYGGSAEDFLDITFAEGNTTLINHDILFGASVYTFETNGGDPIDPYFATMPLDVLPTPEKEGSAFAGWYASPDFAGAPLTAPLDAHSAMTLYAKWKTTLGEKMDFSGDGVLDAADALLGLRLTLNGGVTDAHDVSGDGRFTLMDILRILKAIVG